MAQADIAIVGAGIIGCLTANEIASRAPDVSVAILDRDAVGSGASRRSARLHFPRGATDRVRRMTAYSQDYYEQLKKTRPSLPIHPVGMFVVAFEASARRVQETYLDRAELVRTDGVPGHVIRVPEAAGVWHGSGCHYADVPLLRPSPVSCARASTSAKARSSPPSNSGAGASFSSSVPAMRLRSSRSSWPRARGSPPLLGRRSSHALGTCKEGRRPAYRAVSVKGR
jgi:hypothetical protein